VSNLVWEQRNYTTYVTEGTTDFAPIATVQINSSMSTNWTDSYKPVLYGFHNAQDLRSLEIFSIDILTGMVSVEKSSLIDREILSRHLITVKARNPVHAFSFVRLLIIVEDRNDHAPFFPSQNSNIHSELKIPETTAVGTLLAQV